jgi:thiol-disulfide isomerase/thioredoxin
MKIGPNAYLRTSLLLLPILVLPVVAVLRSSGHQSTADSSADQLAGAWDATVKVGPADIPFRFEISRSGSDLKGFFFEGDKGIGSTSATYSNSEVQFDYEFLDTTLTATFNGDSLDGTYRSHRKNGKEYPFHARRSVSRVTAVSSSAPQVSGDWEMKLVGEDKSGKKDLRLLLSWKLYLRQSGTNVTGSILRVDGDTGTLTGHWAGDSLVLSHFAGERPVLLEAKLQPDGTLDILLNNQNRYLAARTSNARTKGIPAPPDPSQYTSVKDSNEPFHFNFPDVSGKVVSDTDAQFRGKVVVLAIGGTWCPNCRDEAPFLVDLYKRYHGRGLEIVGLNFEASGDLTEDKPRIQSFVNEFSVPYPILYAGAIPDVREKLPQIANFGAYPTTIYLARDGRVSDIHAGFASAATGEAHTALQREVDELVERLLQEKSSEIHTSGLQTSAQ